MSICLNSIISIYFTYLEIVHRNKVKNTLNFTTDNYSSNNEKGLIVKNKCSAFAGAAELPQCDSAGAGDHTQRPPEAPPGRSAIKEDELENKG